MTFYGTFRGTPEQLKHVHESPASMTGPLWILAAGAAVVGWFGDSEVHPREGELRRNVPGAGHHAARGRLAARAPRDRTLDRMAPDGNVGGRGPSRNLSRVDVLQRRVPLRDARARSRPPSAASTASCATSTAWTSSTRPSSWTGLIKKGGRLLWEIDARVVDLIPNGAASFTVGLSNVSSWFDRTFVDGAVNGVGKPVPGRVSRDASRPDRPYPELCADDGRRHLRFRVPLSPPEVKDGE